MAELAMVRGRVSYKSPSPVARGSGSVISSPLWGSRAKPRLQTQFLKSDSLWWLMMNTKKNNNYMSSNCYFHCFNYLFEQVTLQVKET